MSSKVVILNSAKLDLKELRDYVIARFSRSVWLETSESLKSTMLMLAGSPQAGSVPVEIEMLNLNEYRQVVSGMNRVIYEIRQDVVFIHAIVDVRRDMISLLTRRLLRTTL